MVNVFKHLQYHHYRGFKQHLQCTFSTLGMPNPTKYYGVHEFIIINELLTSSNQGF